MVFNNPETWAPVLWDHVQVTASPRPCLSSGADGVHSDRLTGGAVMWQNTRQLAWVPRLSNVLEQVLASWFLEKWHFVGQEGRGYFHSVLQMRIPHSYNSGKKRNKEKRERRKRSVKQHICKILSLTTLSPVLPPVLLSVRSSPV